MANTHASLYHVYGFGCCPGVGDKPVGSCQNYRSQPGVESLSVVMPDNSWLLWLLLLLSLCFVASVMSLVTLALCNRKDMTLIDASLCAQSMLCVPQAAS